MANKIFISYASEDFDIAGKVCSFLEDNNLTCWMAPRDILPGMDYAEAIIEAIDGSQFMVLIFSASANESPHILREVERAVNKRKRVISYRIENVEPTKSLQYYLGVPHWLNAFPPPHDTYLPRLLEVINRYINEGTTPGPSPARTESPAGTTKRGDTPVTKKRLSARIILLSLLAIIILGIVIGYPILSGMIQSPPAPQTDSMNTTPTITAAAPTLPTAARTIPPPTYDDAVIEMEVLGENIVDQGSLVTITGMNHATNTTYLYLTSNKVKEGAPLENPSLSVSTPVSFSSAPVGNDFTWTYIWNTSAVPETTTYTLFASVDPLPYSKRIFNGYASERITIKVPFVPPTLDPKSAFDDSSSSGDGDSGSGAGF